MANRIEKIKEYLSDSQDDLLTHNCKTVTANQFTLPGPDYLDKVFTGSSDFSEELRTAIINKRAGITGLISGRKTFSHPFKEGIQRMNIIQDVYPSNDITVA
jgi:hypothetical protein